VAVVLVIVVVLGGGGIFQSVTLISMDLFKCIYAH